MSRDQDRPEFSIVVASFSGRECLAGCLGSIVSQSAGGEVIVATNLCAAEREQLGRIFPGVHFVGTGCKPDVFRLRSLGIAAARGAWIALTEDHCIASPGWIAALREAIGERTMIAGPVLPDGFQRWTDRALFLCEYANLLPPLLSERLAFVSGVNAAYPREALEHCRDVWQNGFYENEVSDALRSAGYEFGVAPEALVYTRLTMPLSRALIHFCEGGRRYGGYRGAHLVTGARVIRLLATPAVPLVLLGRILRNVLGRDRGSQRRGRGWKIQNCGEASVIPSEDPAAAILNFPHPTPATLLPALPIMLLLLAAWALGEAAGLLLGRRADEQRGACELRATDAEPA